MIIKSKLEGWHVIFINKQVLSYLGLKVFRLDENDESDLEGKNLVFFIFQT